jgi:hypothetical protein
MNEKKLDIFDEMAQADLGNKDFYAELEPELQKQFSPLVAMRWFSTVADNSQFKDYTLILTNEILNVDFWSLKDHPELQWKLMSTCGVGKKLRHQWIPMPKRRKISKVAEFMLQWFPSANDQELHILTENLTREDFEQFVKSTGCTEEELKEVVDSFDIDRGVKPAKASKAKAGSKKRKS